MAIQSVRELAVVAGISEQAVRDYEAAGLLPPVPRQANGYRAYSEIHLVALLAVRGMKAAGYQRAEMQAVMDGIHWGSLSAALSVIDRHHVAISARREALTVVTRVGVNDGAGTETISIGQVAQRLGITAATLRFWESMRLINPERDQANGYRRFSEADVARIADIVRMRALGVPWDAIRAAVRTEEQEGVEMLKATMLEIDRQSWLNVRATTLICVYASAWRSAAEGTIVDPMLRSFLDHLPPSQEAV